MKVDTKTAFMRFNLRPDDKGTESPMREELNTMPVSFNLRPDDKGTESTKKNVPHTYTAVVST